MAKTQMLLVRVYVTESRARLARLLELLREANKLRGLTVFRGAAGFGSTLPREASAAEPQDPPIVLEFFETRENAIDAVRYIRSLVAPHHVVSWPVDVDVSVPRESR